MGIFKRLFGGFFQKTKVKMVVVGLENSGKTTILNYLKPGKAKMSLETVPTIGVSTEEFQKNGVNFVAFDMSGQGRYRNLWEHYYGEIQGVVFVIDSTDRLRFAVAKDELDGMLKALREIEVKDPKIPVLFFANKMDLPQAASPMQLMQALKLEDITDRPWHIAASNALAGEGVEEGIKWLVEAMKNTESQKK